MSKTDEKNQKIYNVEEFFSISWTFYKTLGVEPYIRDDQTSRKSFVFAVIFYFGFCNLNLINVFGEFVYLYKAIGSFANFLEATALAPCIGFCLLADCKLLTVWWNKNKLTSIMSELTQIFPKTLTIQNKYHIAKYLRYEKRTMTAFAVLIMVLIWVFNLFTVVQTTVEYLFMGKEFGYNFPYFVWYPFDPKHPTIYAILYISQSYAGYVAAAGALSTDIFLCCTVILLCIHFDYIARTISELQPNRNGGKPDCLALGKLVQYHAVILRLSEDLNNIFSTVILFNFLGMSVIICLVGFQVTAGVEPTDLFKYLLFLVWSLIQVILQCHFGQMLIDSSESIYSATYNHQWFESDIKYKKMMILIMNRAQKPSVLKATNFSVISLSTFNLVISLSYKFFALLRTMYSK